MSAKNEKYCYDQRRKLKRSIEMFTIVDLMNFFSWNSLTKYQFKVTELAISLSEINNSTGDEAQFFIFREADSGLAARKLPCFCARMVSIALLRLEH